MYGIKIAPRAIYALSEQSFIGFNAEARNESESGAKEKNTQAACEGCVSEWRGVRLHIREGLSETEMIPNAKKSRVISLARRLLKNGSCRRRWADND
jgi:hypothetical protein